MREETSIFGNKMREAGSDVLGSLRARASSHLSALLSPARESPPPPPPPQLPIELDDDEDAVSPVYEEASDLASSIAKLRALLQHHEHKSSTDEEELAVHSTEDLTRCDGDADIPPRSDHAPQDSSIARPMWELHPEVDNSETDWMEAEEAPELPDDGRPFMNISIPATELSCDTSGQQFVQYCIQV